MCSVGVLKGVCMYMTHLAVLDSKQTARPIVEGASIQSCVTLMVANEWKRLHALHPDDAYRVYFVKGIRDGFFISATMVLPGAGGLDPTCHSSPAQHAVCG